MPAFMITVYQVRAYAVALFGGALLLLHVAVLIQRSRSAGEGSLRVLAQQSGTFHSSIDPCHNISRVRKASQAFLNTLNTLNIIANRPPSTFHRKWHSLWAKQQAEFRRVFRVLRLRFLLRFGTSLAR